MFCIVCARVFNRKDNLQRYVKIHGDINADNVQKHANVMASLKDILKLLMVFTYIIYKFFNIFCTILFEYIQKG
jgi:hypothetical protein